jgi:uncharacterized protein (UPF0335 family)
MAEIGHNSGSSDDRLRLLMERIDRLEEEKKGISDDIRDTYAEAKGQGYDTKIMRAVRARAKLGVEGRNEYDALVQMYEAAIGQA